jgi:DNA ligase-1
MSISKPMLASDYEESKIRFPVIAQPKIDGVRSLNMDGTLTGRSLKKHANFYTTTFFSHTDLIGFDGEMAAEYECHPDLCRLTTSALSRIAGHPFILWWAFDYIAEQTKDLPYSERMKALNARVDDLRSYGGAPHPAQYIRVVPSVLVRNMEELLAFDQKCLDMGFEGTIIRDPEGKHKQGRSTVREGGLLRIKRFIDAEIVVTEILEGEMNGNDAQLNELGLQFRSSHQENMVPNGMVGAMMGRLLADVVSDGTTLFKAGEIVKVGAGKMPHEDRVKFFNNPELLLEQIVKFKLFPKGVKDKPRFPTFQSLRSPTDM